MATSATLFRFLDFKNPEWCLQWSDMIQFNCSYVYICKSTKWNPDPGKQSHGTTCSCVACMPPRQNAEHMRAPREKRIAVTRWVLSLAIHGWRFNWFNFIPLAWQFHLEVLVLGRWPSLDLRLWDACETLKLCFNLQLCAVHVVPNYISAFA